MGSLLTVIAVMVTANAPAAVDGAAVKVSTARPPMVAVRGANDAVTPLGRPLALRVRPGQTRQCRTVIAACAAELCQPWVKETR
jgi:hypothetical protein